MAEAVSIVVSDGSVPAIGMANLELYRVMNDALATPPVRTSHANLTRDEVDEPVANDRFGQGEVSLGDRRSRNCCVV